MRGPGSVPVQLICWTLDCVSGGSSLGGGVVLTVGLVGTGSVSWPGDVAFCE